MAVVVSEHNLAQGGDGGAGGGDLATVYQLSRTRRLESFSPDEGYGCHWSFSMYRSTERFQLVVRNSRRNSQKYIHDTLLTAAALKSTCAFDKEVRASDQNNTDVRYARRLVHYFLNSLNISMIK